VIGAWLFAAALGNTSPTAIPADASRAKALKAAQECGAKIDFVALPDWVTKQRPDLAGKHSVEVDPKATPAQQKCFAAKFPMTRVGFISAPPLPKKKN
jgi:hypothetical protein